MIRLSVKRLFDCSFFLLGYLDPPVFLLPVMVLHKLHCIEIKVCVSLSCFGCDADNHMNE